LSTLEDLYSGKTKITIPSPKSASGWTVDDLDYYNIKILPLNNICDFKLPNIELEPAILESLTKHSDSYIDEYVKEVENENLKSDSLLASNFLTYIEQINIESNIDNFAKCLLKRYLVKDFQYKLNFIWNYMLIKKNDGNC
jgi:hypothetical protein